MIQKEYPKRGKNSGLSRKQRCSQWIFRLIAIDIKGIQFKSFSSGQFRKLDFFLKIMFHVFKKFTVAWKELRILEKKLNKFFIVVYEVSTASGI